MYFFKSSGFRYSVLRDNADPKNGSDGSADEISTNPEHAESSNSFLYLRQRRPIGHPTTWLWINLSLLLSSSALFALALGLYLNGGKPNKERNALLKDTSYYSPLLDEFDIPMVTTQIDAHLLAAPSIGIFSKEPTPEVDEAWNRLTPNPWTIAISREDVEKLGRDPSRAAKWPESMGMGPEAYVARVDVFHQIHCLNSLRREIYFDHYYGNTWPDGRASSTKTHKLHVAHCINLLLQNIMCTANVDVYTFMWTDAAPMPIADSSVYHQCRDFDAIYEWTRENGVNGTAVETLRREDDQPYHRMTYEVKKVFGFFAEDEDDGSSGDEII